MDRTDSKIDTPLTQPGSRHVPLPDCIRHLKAMRLPLATTLAQQLENYERDPEGMRPGIRRTLRLFQR